MSLQPGARLGPYKILSLLGVGGMGEVWLAEDPRLGRRVALKSAPASAFASEEGRGRLEREARAAARLNHPGIAAVYDVLEHDGQLHIVMEYAQGDTLAALLRRGPLSVEQTLDIGVQLADALSAAHAADVIHRDLKPSNVALTSDGRVKVLDFGIARVGGSTAGRKGTASSVLFGTPGYTPPEQLLGAAAAPRGDVYSAGAVLYELLTGRPPFVPEPGQDPRAAALIGSPPPIQDLNPAVPDALAAVITRALARNPDERYASARQFHTDLRRIASALIERPTGANASELPTMPLSRRSAPRWQRRHAWIAAAVLLALGAAIGVPRLWRGARQPREAAVVPAALPIVAVMPLENLSGDSAKDYLGAGMAETLTMALSKVQPLAVLTRAEVLEAMRRSGDPRSVAKNTGASYIVGGAIQQAGDQLLATLRLMSPEGDVMWGESFEASSREIFDLQRRMGSALVDRLQTALGVTVAGPAPVPTSNVGALTEYWQARSTLEQATTVAQTAAAVAGFTRATELDPSFALAYAGLADACWQHYQLSHDAAMTRRALEAGLTALRLDPDQADVRSAVAGIYVGLGRYEEAEEQARHALTLQPGSDSAYRVLARVQFNQGKGDAAVESLQRAVDVRPRQWLNHYDLGGVYLRLRRAPEAAAAYERALELRPNDPRIYGNLGAAYARMWENEKALDAFERANRLTPSRIGFSNVGWIRYRLGNFKGAVEAYSQALRLDPKAHVTNANLGDAYLRLGRAAEARRQFETARALALDELKVNDRDARTLAALGTYEASLGAHADADQHSARAVALTPDDPDVVDKRAVVHALAGREVEALQALERAIELRFDRREAREDADLRSLRTNPAFQALVADR